MTAQDQQKHQRNEAMKEHDHAPLREAISAVTRRTGLKVLLCPEDRSQMAVGKEMLLDKLPDDVKPKVVWREQYWLTDEAVSTYVRTRRPLRQRDAFAHHVHRSWPPRSRLPVPGADQQRLHVA